jgi:hypothetical protein
MPKESPTNIESAVDHPLQPSVVPKLAMSTPAPCSTECRDVISKHCEVPVHGSTTFHRPSLDRSLGASCVSRPLKWTSFQYGDSEVVTSSGPATQGTWPYLEPKPTWVTVQDLFSERP